MNAPLHGLVAATHTPFHADGALNLAAVERQAEGLLRTGVSAAFVGGTTGESASLTVDERLALARRWADVCRGTPLRLVVHVGANCLADAKALAADAQAIKADAISAVSPSYFKPRSLDVLIDCCREVAAAAPGLPYYHYDIPPLTGVAFPMPDFLAAAERLPTLAGIKFSNPDLLAYQQCLAAAGGRWDMPWGIDEALLAALALGAKGAVGSTYNFAAPVYQRLLQAFAAGDLAAARAEQLRSVRIVAALAKHGYMAAAKATMGFLGIEVGPPRLPNARLSDDAGRRLRGELDALGFFGWLAPNAG